jgi:ABC-type nitrate/sulfonate/bicarbonate transport system ATPase subunit
MEQTWFTQRANDTSGRWKFEDTLLSVQNVNLSFGTKQVLRDVNFSISNITRPGVAQGQTVALLGPSGIGKTQLFKCIAGLQYATSGHINLMRNGQMETTMAGHVGFVQQSYPLLEHRLIKENLSLFAADKGKVNALVERFGLTDQLDKFPQQLSGGQRQRVAILQQLLRENHFILMDEPFSGLDIVAKEKVCQLLTDVALADEHNTTIFTTHDIEAAVMIADTIIVLGREQGKEGATIVEAVDLTTDGFAWVPVSDAKVEMPFAQMQIKRLKRMFKNL